MASLSISLKPILLVKLDEMAEKLGYTKSRIAEEAISTYLAELEEDGEDARDAEEAWNNFLNTGAKSIPAKEVYKELSL